MACSTLKNTVLVLFFALHAVFGSWDGSINFLQQVCITIYSHNGGSCAA